MSLHNTMTTITGAVVGASGVTFPLWSDLVTWATGINQWFVALGGALVIILTIMKLVQEIRIANRRLRELERGPPK